MAEVRYSLSPDAGAASTTVDGDASHSLNDQTWATIQGAAGNGHTDTSATASVLIQSGSTTGWRRINRMIFTFDLSAIEGDPNEVALFLYGSSKSAGIGLGIAMNVYSANPADPSNLANGDFDSLGAVALSDPIAFDDWRTDGYNRFKLNAIGLGIVKEAVGGILEIGTREANFDAPNSEPGSGAGSNNLDQMLAYMADQGASQAPVLEIVSTVPEPLNKYRPYVVRRH